MKKLALLLALCLFVQCIGLTAVFAEEEVVIPAAEEALTSEAAPAEEAPAEEAPVQEVPAETAPAEEAPAEEVPGEEAPAEEAPAEEAPAEEAPAEEAPAEEAPAEEAPAEEAPAEEAPAEEAPAEEAPAEEAEPEPEFAIHLATLKANAVLYKSESLSTKQAQIANDAVVVVLEEGENAVKVQYAADGALVEAYVNANVLTDLAEEEAQAWQNKVHEQGINGAEGFVLEAVELVREEPVPVVDEEPISTAAEPVPAAEESVPAAAEENAPVTAEKEPEAETASIGEGAATMILPEGVAPEDAADVLGAGEYEFPADVLAAPPASTDFEIAYSAIAGGYVIIQYNSSNTVVNITPTILDRNGNPQTVVGIQRAAFRGNTKITHVNLPTTISWIDEEAFKGCTALQNIDLPNQVTTIRNSSFSGCTSLTAVSWTDQVTTIDTKAFEGCTSLATLGTSTNVTWIGNDAFKGCANLKAVTWSDQLQWIGDNCYENCTSLTALLFPAALQSIGNEAFKGCTGVQTVDFQTNTTMQSIGNGAFQNCTAIKELYIPDSVNFIGDSAFENCSSAKVLSLPASLTVIEDFCFRNCTSLMYLGIPNGVTDIHQEAFYNCSSIAWIHSIPASVTFIGDRAFDGLSYGCWIVVENPNVKITTDGLGTNTNLFGWLNSTAEAYARNHANVHHYNIQTVRYVRRCYDLILNRPGEGAGIMDWSKKLALRNETGASIVHGFIFSTEFAARGLSDSQVVEILYNTMLDRASDPAGKADWMGFLNMGCSYDYVIKGFSGAPEFINMCSNVYAIDPGTVSLTQNRDKNPPVTAFVKRCYQLILNRNPEVAGLNDWTGELNSKRMSGGQVVAGFVASPEFRGRNLSDSDQVEIIYQTMLSRASDASGKAYWLSFMAQNMTIECVVKGFSGSLEFRYLCQGYNIDAGPVTPSEYRDRNPAVTVFVNRIYQYALNRTPDIPGLNSLTGTIITKGGTAAAVAKSAFTSLECQMRGLSNPDYVDALYRGYLNRVPSAAEKTSMVNRLNAGTSRETLCDLIGGSDEFKAIVDSFGL